MMAMLFLTQERLEIGEATLTTADVQMMLVHYLPRRTRSEDDMHDMLRTRLACHGQTLPTTYLESDKVELVRKPRRETRGATHTSPSALE